MEDALHIDAILGRLRAYRKARSLSFSALAQCAGLSRAALRGMDDADWAPTSSTIRAVERLIPPGWRVGDPAPVVVEDSTAAERAGASP